MEMEAINRQTLKDRLKSYRNHPGSFLLFLMVMLATLATFAILVLLLAGQGNSASDAVAFFSEVYVR